MTAALQKKVLTLNKSYCPLKVITARRAISLVSAGRACVIDRSHLDQDMEVIDPTQQFREMTWEDWANVRPNDDDHVLRGIRLSICVPKIIKLNESNRIPFRHVVFSRARIYQRDRYTCQYCGAQPGTPNLNIDHIVPRAQGGGSNWINCVLACIECNSRKANRTPEQAGMKLRKKPIMPKYTILREDIREPTWEVFLGTAYWVTELYSD